MRGGLHSLFIFTGGNAEFLGSATETLDDGACDGQREGVLGSVRADDKRAVRVYRHGICVCA